MPFIETKLSVPLSAEKEEVLGERIGKAIELIPGKSERWLMLSFEDNCRLRFGGDAATPAAIAEVKLFGKAEKAAYDALTGALTEIISSEVGIPPERIYVRYDETEVWGWSGSNF